MFNKARKNNKKGYSSKYKDKEGRNSGHVSGEKNHPGEQTSKPQGKHALHSYYFKLWLDWLVQGTLPSYAIYPEKELILYVLEALVLDNKAFERLRLIIKEHPRALERLIQQHRTTDLVSIIELYTGFSHKKLRTEIKDFIKNLKRVSPKSKISSQRQQEILIWRHVLQRVIVLQEKLDFAAVKASLEKIQLKEKELPVEKEDLTSPQFFKNAGVILLHPFLTTFF